jgi:CRISPR-associated protein Csb2
MNRTLLLTVRFHEGRYHGVPDWPPSPARLFQALVAGAARGNGLSSTDIDALHWLEALDAPCVAAPVARRGASFTSFVPNNDLDAVGGHPSRTSEIRSAKLTRPQIFDAAIPLLYAWSFVTSAPAYDNANCICEIAQRLYQLGRGVDMAWAVGEVLGHEEADARLASYQGPVHRTTIAHGGATFECPGSGSLDSLIERHAANANRFSSIIEAAPTAKEPTRTKVTGTSFSQAPKGRFVQVAYDCPSSWLLFDLSGIRAPWALTRTVELVSTIRDAAAAKLKAAYEIAGRAVEAAGVEAALIGRGSTNADKSSRIRIIPLPSIGSVHVTRAIRRVLVEVPANCPIPCDDLAWTFSGLFAERTDPDTGEVLDIWRLTPADDRKMLAHYGVEPPASTTHWQSVTPLALPESARRRRIEPGRKKQEAKGGVERTTEETNAVAAVVAALRHAGVSATANAVKVQREPFSARGMRAEPFAPGTRFAKEQLWHVELQLDRSVSGPMLLGDGRYLGLGLMAPVNSEQGVLVFRIVEGLDASADFATLTHALRRAVMSRVRGFLQTARGLRSTDRMPAFFTGHEMDGSVARSGGNAHIAYAYDKRNGRLLVLAPHVLEGRHATRAEREHFASLATALIDLNQLRAGRAGMLKIELAQMDAEVSQLIRPSQVWQTVTPYFVNRYRKLGDAAAAVSADVSEACRALGLPAVQVTVLSVDALAGRGLSGQVRLRFGRTVEGPILIGRQRHFGGGLFESVDQEAWRG